MLCCGGRVEEFIGCDVSLGSAKKAPDWASLAVVGRALETNQVEVP